MQIGIVKVKIHFVGSGKGVSQMDPANFGQKGITEAQTQDFCVFVQNFIFQIAYIRDAVKKRGRGGLVSVFNVQYSVKVCQQAFFTKTPKCFYSAYSEQFIIKIGIRSQEPALGLGK